MATASLGQLTLDLIAKIGGYVDGLTKAERATRKSTQQMEKDFLRLQTRAVAVGTFIGNELSVGIRKAFAAFPNMVEEIANFQDLSDKIGDTAEAISGLRFASDVSGVSLDEISSASVRLTASLTQVDDDSKKAGAALKALGIDLEAFKSLTPTQQLQAAADALAKFEDGAGKTAVAVDLFGKAGAQLLPFLKDLNELGQENGRLTAQQIEEADKLSKSFARLQSNAKSLALSLASELIPALNRIFKNISDLQGAGVLGSFLKDTAKDVVGLGRLTADAGKDINSLLRERERLEKNIAFAQRRGLPTDQFQKDKQELENLLKISRIRQTNSLLASGDTGDFVSRRFLSGGAPTLNYAGSPDKTKNAKSEKQEVDESATALAAYVKQLQSTIDKTEELTEVEKANRFLLGQGKAGEIPQVRELVLGLAERADKEKEINDYIKLRRELITAEGDAVNEANEKRARELDAIYNSTPTAKLEEQRRIVGELTADYTNGLKTQTEYEEAVSSYLGLTAEKLEKNKSLADELGLSFSSAFEDAIVGGKGLVEVLKGLEQDILRIVTRKLVTEPLGNALTGMLGGATGGGGAGGGFLSGITSSIGGWFKNLLNFDGGGSTGSGARAGGLDGKGGFMAMLHPQEEVIDRSRGQRGGGGVTMVLNQNFPQNTSIETMNQAAARAQIALNNAQRNL